MSIGNIVNYFKSQGRKTGYDAVAAYIGYIEDSFLAYRCERFDLRGKEILSGTAKYYINDLVFKNFLYPGTAYGVGYKLENLVYLELLRAGYDVYTGCAKEKEVDFIARKGDRTIYLQSTYMLVDEQTARVSMLRWRRYKIIMRNWLSRLMTSACRPMKEYGMCGRGNCMGCCERGRKTGISL